MLRTFGKVPVQQLVTPGAVLEVLVRVNLQTASVMQTATNLETVAAMYQMTAFLRVYLCTNMDLCVRM